MASLDFEVVQILFKSGCGQQTLNFGGLTMEKLYQYSLEDFRRVLPDADEEIVRKILEEVQNSKIQREVQNKEDDDIEILDVIITENKKPVTVKQEVGDDDRGHVKTEANSINTTQSEPEGQLRDSGDNSITSQSNSINVLSVDAHILQILIKFNCSQHALKFTGITMDKLCAYNFQDFARILPNESEEVIRQIEEEVQRSKASQENNDMEILNMITRKDQEMTVEEIIIDEDEDPQNERRDGVNTSNNSDSVSSSNNNTNSSEVSEDLDDDTEENPQDKLILLNPKKGTTGLKQLCGSDEAHIIIKGHKNPHDCTYDHPSELILQRWAEGLTNWGSNIQSLEMSTWTWMNSASDCPFNLFKILTHYCPSIRDLTLTKNPCKIPRHVEVKFPKNLTLPNLKTITMSHDAVFSYGKELNQILRAAPNLLEIDFSYGNLEAATLFLEILQNLNGDHLKNIRILSLKSPTENGYLTKSQIVQLTKLAISLEELELSNGLWEDVDGPTLEGMIRHFPNLKELVINGCYKGTSPVKPDILINFPVMNQLRIVRIGINYTYPSVFEKSRPQSKPQSSINKYRKGMEGQRLSTTVDEMGTSFPISLQFPILPKLVTLDLGNLFNIPNFHFASFPKLEYFYVPSHWDLSVTFPNEKSRRGTYPLIKDMEFPDGLDDPSFVKLIPRRFPNLMFCRMTFPSVLVLRTFFKIMEDSKLQELWIDSQFDFESTLENCLLDKPTEVIPSAKEVKKVQKIPKWKEYRHWEDWVKSHNVQLPPENLSSLQGDDLGGLSCLKNLKRITLVHFPRSLRIPKGHLHWTDPKCKYTGDLIGVPWGYPWSRALEDMRNELVERNRLVDKYCDYVVPFRATVKPDLPKGPRYYSSLGVNSRVAKSE